MLSATLQNVTDGEELRFLILDDTAVGRNAYLAVGKGVQSIDGLVGRNARHEMYKYLNVGSCEVFDFANLYLVFVNGLGDRFDKCLRSL